MQEVRERRKEEKEEIGGQSSSTREWSLLPFGGEWNMRADLHC